MRLQIKINGNWELADRKQAIVANVYENLLSGIIAETHAFDTAYSVQCIEFRMENK